VFGRTPRQAVQAYVDSLQTNIALICKGVLFADNYDVLEQTSVLTLRQPVSLHGRPDVFLAIAQQYRIVRDPSNGPFRVTALQYKYAVETDGAREIVGYHWHPHGSSPVKFNHLHLGPGAEIGRPELHNKAHFPTGPVSFDEVIDCVIHVFEVKVPLMRTRTAG